MQTTLSSSVHFSGIGLHCGVAVQMTIRPAAADTGIAFWRSDVRGADPLVPARWDAVAQSRLCTQIENAHGVSVSTIEHVMAALAGCGVHNALIEIDGPEVPILDGSSAPFVRALIAAGLQGLGAPLRALRVLKSVEVRAGAALARLEPADSMEIAFAIDFADAAIGRQSLTLNMANGAFVRELMDSRTFCRQSDVEQMQAAGLALGGSYENAVVVDGDRVLSPGGLRREREAVRHKMLDAMGDLALAGAPILGRYYGNRAGHALTNQLLRALFADPAAWRWEPLSLARAHRMPGAGVTLADCTPRATALA
ncbi:UDP-3-O-acyl-N-acetylglucosamine deacetylase [Phaeovulum sp.]|uniref:UDP-3-O-acyl-N-acetylglucosamine deacetylase n=1 Tax=Phaeovulum sp. TaxID=2934796 RepID=UPI00273016F7|nr:UDP-3-O-acyl-N-acetylglucosamine deacetylase [Phaeovulum sp.]MDP1668432.1 UDP-3-O-acyl-N-acetylglucosamine deacetylase [Phaeovulum sp.]MDZ4118875.1 UDP-3-O-acyl-N-acetylglucosamine deacetylase [Phaeovulum sp.]